MDALVNVRLHCYDEKTDGVLLYSEKNVTVVSVDKIRIHIREAYKILRPNGREHGTVIVFLYSGRKVTSLHGWGIAAQGKDYEVKEKDSMEISPPMIAGIELIDDVKAKILHIPAPDPGNVIGYEYEVEEHPLVLQDSWHFQEKEPVMGGSYSVQLPAGWEYKASWLNYPPVVAEQTGNNQWQWAVSDVKAIRTESSMPPYGGVGGQMIISFFPPGGLSRTNGFGDRQGI